MKKHQTKILNLCCYLLLIATALAALWAMTRGLDKPLLGPHSFRQTQTAISAYYMAKDPSMFFNYITPVLGKPWQIPMEVPIYQWIVARIHNMSGIPLDAAGRMVSIAMWFLCLIPAWSILRSLGTPPPAACLGLAVMLSSPLYLFWGQAFLIETTGLLFSLGMVACVLRGLDNRSWTWLLLALGLGVLAALCKATTWTIAAGVSILLILIKSGVPKLKELRWVGVALLSVSLPLLPAKLWLAWGDALKASNPFAREIIMAGSTKQASWNFGTWEQKLDPAVWEQIWTHISEGFLVQFPGTGKNLIPLLLILGAAMFPRRFKMIFLLLAGFAAAPIIFTNLYFEHSYYWCANGIWLLLAVGCAISCVWDHLPKESWPKILALSLASAISISGFLTWQSRFLPILEAFPTQLELADSWTRPVQKLVPEQRTLLIIGNDWNPNSLYYSRRKGIALPMVPWIPLPGPQLDESLSLLGSKDGLGAVVINERMLTNENTVFFTSLLKQLEMSEDGIRTPFGIVFQALDLKIGQLPAGG